MIFSFVIHLLRLYAADGNASGGSGATIHTSRKFKVCKSMSLVYMNGNAKEVLSVDESLFERHSDVPSCRMAFKIFLIHRKVGKLYHKYLNAFVNEGNILEKEISRMVDEKEKQRITELEKEKEWLDESEQRYVETKKRDAEKRSTAQARQEDICKIMMRMKDKRKEEQNKLKLAQKVVEKFKEKKNKKMSPEEERVRKAEEERVRKAEEER
ncbi:hypothetical protein VCUG_02168, partial [Vavraia culicis subsp. floridensis]